MATHHVVDCAARTATYHESTPEQLAELEARAVEHQARLAARQALDDAHAADLAMLHEHAGEDPDFAALMRVLGVVPREGAS